MRRLPALRRQPRRARSARRRRGRSPFPPTICLRTRSIRRRTHCRAWVRICATLPHRRRFALPSPSERARRLIQSSMQRVLRIPRFLSGRFAPAVFVLAIVATAARADDAAQWLARASQAARQLDYVGTIVYQIGPRVESSRITHLYQDQREFAKLVNLDGPAREVVRNDGRSEEHTSELQSRRDLVCRLLLEKKKSAPG